MTDRPTDSQVAHQLANRLIPTNPALASELGGKLLRRPEVIEQARTDMDAAERAMVRESCVYLRGLTDLITTTVRAHQPPKRAA